MHPVSGKGRHKQREDKQVQCISNRMSYCRSIVFLLEDDASTEGVADARRYPQSALQYT